MTKLPDKQPDYQDFANRFGVLLKPLRRSRIVLHIASGLIEAIAIRLIIASELSISNKLLAALIIVAITMFLIVVIEGGISILNPVLFDQVVERKWKGRKYQIMFMLIAAIVLPLWILSPVLSKWGGELTVDGSVNRIERSDLGVFDQEFRKESERLLSIKASDKADIENRFESLRSAIENKYAALANVEANKMEKNKKLVQKGHTWAASHIAVSENKLANLEKEKAAELVAITADKNQALDELNKRFEADKLAEEKSIRERKKRKIRNEEAAISRQEFFISRWSGFAGWIGFLVSVLAILTYLVESIIKVGSGVEWQDIDAQARVKPINHYGEMIFSSVAAFFQKEQTTPHTMSPAGHPKTKPLSAKAKTIKASYPVAEAESESETDYELESETEKEFDFENQAFAVLSEAEKIQIQGYVESVLLHKLEQFMRNSAIRRIESHTQKTRAQHNYKLHMAIRRATQIGWSVHRDGKAGLRIQR